MRHVSRLCRWALALCSATLLAANASAQQISIDTSLKVTDVDEQPVQRDYFVLRDSEGFVISTAPEADGGFTFRATGRKLSIELTPKGLKQRVFDLVLEDAPKVFVTVRVDPATGHVKEITQKPYFPVTNPGKKVRRPGGGQTGLLAPPTNDPCSAPIAIGLGATPFDTTTATTDGPANACSSGSLIHNDVWYTVVAPGTGTLTISTCNTATYDTKIAIYNGTSCPPAAPIGCNDDFSGCSGFTSQASAAVVSGNTYLLRIGGFGSTSRGTGTLNVSFVGPPANDECVGAIPVGCNTSTTFSNLAATTNPTDPAFTCRFGGPGQGVGTVWFTITPPGTGAILDLSNSSVSDTLMAVYSGTCGALTQIACDDDSGTGLRSLINFNSFTPGQTYYVQIASFSASSLGTIRLDLTCTAGPPPGDLCSGALPIPCGGNATVNNATFTTDPTDPAYSCRFGGPGQGVGTAWFTFVATATSARVNTIGSTAFDTLLAVYSGTCGAFTELACNDDAVGLLSDLCVTGLTPGQTYYIQASAFSAADVGNIRVNVECPCPAPPANDDCDNAAPLSLPASVLVDNSLATDDIGVPCGVFSGPFKNVWYTVAGTGTTLAATTCNAGTIVSDTKLSVFCADCLEPVCVTGNDDDCPSGGPIFSSTVSWCSQVGANYLITVGNFSPSTTPGQIQLDVFDTGSSCTPDVQCLPTGACCLLNGDCVQLTSDECNAAGGMFQGEGSECASNAIADGSFEAGAFGGVWTESSTNFGTPLCDSSCGLGGGTGPRTGLFWSWFGGIPAFEEGSVSQNVVIPVAATTLDFYLEIPVASGNGVDFLEVTIDGNQEFLIPEAAGPYIGYALIQVPLAGYNDGGAHTVEFHSIITGTLVNGAGFTNFFVDDVSINVNSVDCPQPDGACCLSDGSCVEVTEEECNALGGMFNGDFSLCSGVMCVQPDGACCLHDGSCVEVTQEECDALDGNFNGDFSTCAQVFCPEPTGACCLLNGDCIEVTEMNCLSQNGTYNGDDTTCAQVVCPQPCVTLDFETEDDFATPLGNGQAIDTEFGNLVVISGAGANLGPVIFDSDVGGPNDPAINDDMLINQGNMLCLQESNFPTQTFAGFFDDVTDDRHGGDLIFDFLQPVAPQSVLLADLNPPPNQGATVTLTDGGGRTRVYTVQPGWTGTYGNAGPWQLDLTTLAPQPGNGTPRFATASEMPGFQPNNVVRMVVHMTGYGSMDELVFCY